MHVRVKGKHHECVDYVLSYKILASNLIACLYYIKTSAACSQFLAPADLTNISFYCIPCTLVFQDNRMPIILILKT